MKMNLELLRLATRQGVLQPGQDAQLGAFPAAHQRPAAYLGHLSYNVFRDSLMFPLALSAIGLGVMTAGVLWQTHEVAMGAGRAAAQPVAATAARTGGGPWP